MATHATLVVDACQARITGAAVNDYLARGAIVFVTGSKFMGGPPFSGFALVPAALAAARAAAARGLRHHLPPRRMAGGLAGRRGAARQRQSRPAAAARSLDLRARALPGARPTRRSSGSILAFHAAVRAEIVEKTPARRVAPYPPGDVEEADTHPIEMRTLSTLDLSALKPGGASFEDAQAWHKAMALAGVRVGQPVKCVRLPDGRWGATLRIGLAMGQVVDAAGLSDDGARRRPSPPTWRRSARRCSPLRPSRPPAVAPAPPAPSAAGCRYNSRPARSTIASRPAGMKRAASRRQPAMQSARRPVRGAAIDEGC